MLKRIAIMMLVVVSMIAAKPFHGPRSDKKTYSSTLSSPAQAGDVQLKPGEYKIKLDGSPFVLTDQAGHKIEANATMETADHKFTQTSIAMTTENGGPRIVSIQLGNTSSRIVFQ